MKLLKVEIEIISLPKNKHHVIVRMQGICLRDIECKDLIRVVIT